LAGTSAQAAGSGWGELDKLAAAASAQVQVTANKPSFKPGDQLVVTCQVEKDGYLNILSLGPGDDRPIVLFPNRFHPDNQVKAGQAVTIPPASGGFTLKAQATPGLTRVVVFLTQERINAFEEGQGDSKDVFKKLSAGILKSFAVEQEAHSDYFAAGKLTCLIDTPGETWAGLDRLMAAATQKVAVSVNRTSFRPGDQLVVTCQVDRDGYINILSLGPGDENPTVLFPNSYHPDNQVKAGQTVTIPPAGGGFTLKAQATPGATWVVVFHTQERLNAYEEGQGGAKDVFRTMSPKSLKSFAVEQDQRSNYFGAGKFECQIE
jgi:hypothetical protein